MTTQNILETIPEGYLKNAAGHLVPRANVREQDLLRDEVARNLASLGAILNQQLAAYKKQALADVADVVRIAAEKYGVDLGGKKGNVTLTSFDGRYKVQRSVAELIQFTEEIEAAKALINACIARWSEGANDNIRVIVDRAFRTDTKGQLKTSAIMELMRLDIEDEQWKLAMEAIRDSIQTNGTATYIRLYERIGDSDQYKAIPLDLAAV